MRKSIILIIFFIVSITLLSSCIALKKLYYLRENKNDTSSVKKTAPIPPIYILHKGDMLYIKIIGFDESTIPLFNSIGSTVSYGMTEQLSINLNSYTVNDSGNIVMPLFGKIYVDSLSVEQAQEKIRTTIKNFMSSADVIVKLVSFKITFLGEFSKPGNYTIYSKNLNILEAIGLAGDITAFGDKTKLMIIRQTENNKVYYVDLTKRSIIYSDIFYLKPNDILYAEPLKLKRQPVQNSTISTISVFLASMVNLLVLLKYLVK